MKSDTPPPCTDSFKESLSSRAGRELRRSLSTPTVWLVTFAISGVAGIFVPSLTPQRWHLAIRIAMGLVGFVAVAIAVLGVTWLGWAIWGVFHQRDEARDALANATDRSLRITVSTPKVVDPLGWPAAGLTSSQNFKYRLTVTVVNQGLGGEFEAVMVPGVVGVESDDYGDFFLQWDLTGEPIKRLPAGRSWKLHIAAANRGHLAFLGPPAHHYHYRQWTSEAFEGVIEIRDANSDRFHRFRFRVAFDETTGKPVLTLPPL